MLQTHSAGATAHNKASKPKLAFPDKLINEIRAMIESLKQNFKT
jgi:hypothetical protein